MGRLTDSMRVYWLRMAAISTVDSDLPDSSAAETPAGAAVPPAAPGQLHARDRFVRHANLMSALTVISRVFGLLRDKVCATYLGNTSTAWSAFWMGFQQPNLLRRIFGEGALTAIFVPVYTRVRQERGEAAANKLASATSTLLVLVLGGLTLLGEAVSIPIALSPSVSDKTRLAAAMIAIMLPYGVMVCLVALMGAMATVHEKFTAQSISPVILNLLMTAGAAVPVLIWSSKYASESRVYWVAGAVLVAGVVQVLQMLPTLRACGISLRPTLLFKESGVNEIVRSMVPMMLGLSAVQINTAMDTQIAWWLSPEGHKGLSDFSVLGFSFHTPMGPGAVGVLSVAQRLYLLPVGIFGVSMAAAIFPQMSKAAAGGDMAELKRLLVAGLRKTLFISLPASVGMMLIAKPLITVIYSSDGVQRSAWAAIWFCAGIWAFEGQMVILRAYYALHDRMTPMKVAVGMVVLNFSLNLTLVWFLQEGGIALSTTVSAIIQSALLLWLLRRRLGRLGLGALRKLIIKGTVASGIMAAAAGAVLRAFGGGQEKLIKALVVLPVVVGVAAVVYGFSAWALRMEELRDMPVVGRLMRRGKSAPVR